MLDSAGRRFGPAELQALISLAITMAVMALLLFWPAGTLSWALGWWYIGVFTALTLAAIFWLWRVNPEIFAARSRFRKEGSKGWDVIVASLTMIAIATVLPVAALDNQRFGWAPAPGWAIALGYVLLVASYAWVGWAQAVNRHFEPTVRIQTERGHKVIDTGPYAFVRHPGYIGAIVLAIGTALALGSLWALVPAAAVIIILAGRTLGEEAVLRAELAGYAEYMQRVRYRWVPGIW
jgi:protein-S-isoprenylcysteine O-methyltransferase Ste14